MKKSMLIMALILWLVEMRKHQLKSPAHHKSSSKQKNKKVKKYTGKRLNKKSMKTKKIDSDKLIIEAQTLLSNPKGDPEEVSSEDAAVLKELIKKINDS